jgi:hypothetical protein
MSQQSKAPHPSLREDTDALSLANATRPEIQVAQLFAHIDALERREAQLEATLGLDGTSPVLLSELERARRELAFCYETLEDLGAFDALEGDQAARTS